MIWYVLIQGARKGNPVTAQECLNSAKSNGFSFPALRDPGGKISGRFFSRGSIPLNIIIRTKDMKIIWKGGYSTGIPRYIERAL